jgi:hypothetical protein
MKLVSAAHKFLVQRGTLSSDRDEEYRVGTCQEDGDKWVAFKIFLGSPDGLDDERVIFWKEVDDYNAIEANPRNIHFRKVDWREFPSEYGRPQTHIDNELIGCHAYVLLLWDRWGSSPGVVNGRVYSSGCEEEFELAERCKGSTARPMKKIAVFFKHVDEGHLEEIRRDAEREEQYRRVQQFRQNCENSQKFLHNGFRDSEELRKRIRSFLAKWVLEVTGWRHPIGVKSVLDVAEPDKETLT